MKQKDRFIRKHGSPKLRNTCTAAVILFLLASAAALTEATVPKLSVVERMNCHLVCLLLSLNGHYSMIQISDAFCFAICILLRVCKTRQLNLRSHHLKDQVLASRRADHPRSAAPCAPRRRSWLLFTANQRGGARQPLASQAWVSAWDTHQWA